MPGPAQCLTPGDVNGNRASHNEQAGVLRKAQLLRAPPVPCGLWLSCRRDKAAPGRVPADELLPAQLGDMDRCAEWGRSGAPSSAWSRRITASRPAEPNHLTLCT